MHQGVPDFLKVSKLRRNPALTGEDGRKMLTPITVFQNDVVVVGEIHVRKGALSGGNARVHGLGSLPPLVRAAPDSRWDMFSPPSASGGGESALHTGPECDFHAHDDLGCHFRVGDAPLGKIDRTLSLGNGVKPEDSIQSLCKALAFAIWRIRIT